MVVKIADPLLMREINKYHVLETIRSHGQISRVEISEHTQLSGTTVSAITGALIEEGLVEAIHSAQNGEAPRGRPRVMLGLVRDAAYVVGIKISERLSTATLTDFRGETVAVAELPLTLTNRPDAETVDLIEGLVDDCIGRSGIDRSRIRGIGIGVPGIVDPRSGMSYASSVFGQRHLPIGPLLSERMGIPVKVEKPAHLIALAESWFGLARRARSFAVVLIDQTASLGLWLDDELLRGAAELGPAFGHIKVGGAGLRCECGQNDCLNAHAGVTAMRHAATAQMGADFVASPAAQDDLLGTIAAAASVGDVAAKELLARQGEMLGIGVSHIVNLINPDKIIIATESPRYGEAIAATLRASAAANSFGAHFSATELVFHTLDDRLWAMGAAALMLRDIYSAPWTAH